MGCSTSVPVQNESETSVISADSISKIFSDAHTHYAFDSSRKIDTVTLKKLVEMTLLPPTAFNCSPARVVFVQSAEGKEKLLSCADPGNHDKIKSAPVIAIVCLDDKFLEELPKLYPVYPGAKALVESFGEAGINGTKVRNGDLQGAYFIMAARSLGLATGPMSGFSNDAVDAAFLQGTSWKSNFLVNLGYPGPVKADDKSATRMPRLDFNQAALVL